MLGWAELEPKLEIELRAQDPENPDEAKPLRCGFDEQGCKIFQAPYEEEVELQVHNRSGMRLVAKAFVCDDANSFTTSIVTKNTSTMTMVSTNPQKQPLLLTKNHYKPLFEHKKAIFRGFQTRYHKENYEGLEKWDVLQITRDAETSRGKTATICVRFFTNPGKMTYNRGGGRDDQHRAEPAHHGRVIVPGRSDSQQFPCPPARKRWESRRGHILGEIKIRVKAAGDIAEQLRDLHV